MIVLRLIAKSERETLTVQCAVCNDGYEIPAYYLKIGWDDACSVKCGRKLDPTRYRAREAVNRAVKADKLIKQPCELCGNEPTQAHHDDYAKPLDVRWLCVPHHQAIHNRELDQLLLSSGVQFTRDVEDLPAFEEYYTAAKAAYERSFQYRLGLPQGQKIPDKAARMAKKGSAK
jgi:hypothetical protein